MKKIVTSDLKPTGVLRRMDDLGRLIVPRAIRKDLGFTAGDNFEIFTSDNMVCFVRVEDATSESNK